MYLTLAIFVFATTLSVAFLDHNSGPVGPFKIVEIKQCDPNVNNIDLDIKLETDDNQLDKVSGSFNLPSDLGEDAMIQISADKFENNNWEKDVYNVDNMPLFKFLNDFAPIIWKRFQEAAKIQKTTKIAAGKYEFKDIEATYKEVNSPSIIYGRFMVTISLLQKDEELLCLQAELETFKPK